jgi:hypothetical protein
MVRTSQIRADTNVELHNSPVIQHVAGTNRARWNEMRWFISAGLLDRHESSECLGDKINLDARSQAHAFSIEHRGHFVV